MTTRKVRRAVAASILVAASCNVYNPSLLTGQGGTSNATGGGAGAGAMAGMDVAGTSGSAGTTAGGMGGGSGRGTGGVGAAGSQNGGKGGTTAGSSGTDTGGGAGEAGEAGAMGQGGTTNAGTGGGGTAGTSGSSGIGGAGSGGTAGSAAGSGGMGGTAGTTAGSGGVAGTAAGSAGTAGGGGAGGGTVAMGCANLSVPLGQSTDKAHFVITLTSAQNFSGATISMRVYVQAGSGGVVYNYVQDTNNHFLPATTKPAISSMVGTWGTVSWNVGGEPPASSGIDKNNIKRIGIEVAGLGSSTFVNPTKVYLDSVTVTTPTDSFTFDTSGTVTSNPSSGVDVGGQVLWFNSASSDTSSNIASNVTLGWLASCP